MSFIDYLKDKCYFFILYGIVMLFFSFMFIMTTGSFNNLWYTQFVCLFFVSLYIIIGYYYRKRFYQSLAQENLIVTLPEPQNTQQFIYVELLKKLQDEHTQQLQDLINQKREHQDFITSWIHEIKIPITTSHLLLERNTDYSTDELVDKLEDELNKIESYVEQALYYARIDSFSKDYFIMETDLTQIIKNSIKKYAKLFINKQISLQIEDAPLFIHSDAKWLSFILDQLIANALKYTPEHGAISFHFEEDAKEKRLIIKDTGIGIPPEDIHRVFEKGFTGNTGRGHAKSTGMGLYLSKQLAIQLDNNLSIQSEEGRYTEVTIHFPKFSNYTQFQ